MKKIFLYSFFSIIAIFVNALIAFFVLPVWAICDCLYNDVKSVFLFAGPIMAAGFVIYLTHKKIESGITPFQAFAKSLLKVSLIFIIFNIAKEIILGVFFG